MDHVAVLGHHHGMRFDEDAPALPMFAVVSLVLCCVFALTGVAYKQMTTIGYGDITADTSQVLPLFKVDHLSM